MNINAKKKKKILIVSIIYFVTGEHMILLEDKYFGDQKDYISDHIN